MLIGIRTNDPMTAVVINPDGLLHHALIVGQSGSGKSFFVSRLVEEIILNTAARVVIVDPNGDFRAISAISDIWSAIPNHFAELQRAAQRSPNYDLRDHFTTTWLGRRFLHLYPNIGCPPKDSSTVLHRKLVIHWDALDEEDRDFLLRCSGHLAPRTLIGLEACTNATRFLAQQPNALFENDLRGLVNTAEQFAERNISLRHFPYAKDLTSDDWYTVRANAMDLLRQYTIWWSKTPAVKSIVRPRGLSDFLDGTFHSVTRGSELFWDVMTLELDTARASDALLVVNTTLSRLWLNAKKEWRQATRASALTNDNRVPTFVVIDEAQKFAPASTTDPLRQRVTEQLIQIASEGRKYGLYLILATQRPTKLHPELVPECENSCVLRVQSSIDLEFASSALGIPKQLVANAPGFRKGQGLIAGRWIANDLPIDTRFAPARTVVAGGGLTTGWKTRVTPSRPFASTNDRVYEAVLSELNASVSPVTLAELAEVVRTECPGIDDSSWEGKGSFKALLASLTIDNLRFSAVQPCYAYLANVHQPPSTASSSRLLSVPVELATVLHEINQQTGAPILDASVYQAVFQALSDEVQEHPFRMSEVSKAIRDNLMKRQITVGRAAINFIIHGVHWGGHQYDPDLPQDPKTLATAFVRNLLNLLRGRPVSEEANLNTALSHLSGVLLSDRDVAQVAEGKPIVDEAVPVAEGSVGVSTAPVPLLAGDNEIMGEEVPPTNATCHPISREFESA